MDIAKLVSEDLSGLRGRSPDSALVVYCKDGEVVQVSYLTQGKCGDLLKQFFKYVVSGRCQFISMD